jgi:hypothetical protein
LKKKLSVKFELTQARNLFAFFMKFSKVDNYLLSKTAQFAGIGLEEGKNQ